VPKYRKGGEEDMTTQDALLELLPAEMDDAEYTRCCTGTCHSDCSVPPKE
jgi:hypothetical protein